VCVNHAEKYARASERPSLSCASKRREHTRCAQRERCTTCNTAHTHAQGGPEPDRKDDRNTAAADGRNKQVEWRPPRRSQLEPDAMLTEPTHSCLPGPGCLSPRLPLPRFSCARSRAARGRGRDASKRGAVATAAERARSCVTVTVTGTAADPIDPGSGSIIW
jgi:hypothetical protein